MTKVKLIFFCFLYLCINIIYSQEKVNWSSKSFLNKCFIENKGQFVEEEKIINDNILFSSSLDGIELFFTRTKLVYKYTKTKKLTEEERKELEKNGAKAGINKVEKYYVTMEWQGANTNSEIISESILSNYYTYANLNSTTVHPTIKANAYNKIIYKNIYPNIDIEYVFPKDSVGFKYNIILRKGSDPRLIQMKYSSIDELNLDSYGNIIIKTPFGDIKEHAPKTFDNETNELINSSFILTKKFIGFKLGIYNPEHEIKIDPWVVLSPPAFGYTYFDINYDYNGNVYVFGTGLTIAYELSKFDNTGLIQWTYTANSIASGSFGLQDPYGDFCIDASTGTCYLSEGWNPDMTGAMIAKVNTSGIQEAVFSGHPEVWEMWRMEYDNCNDKIIIGCGGTSYTNQAAIIDTNLTTLIPYNILSATNSYNDVCLMTLDNYGSCYFAMSGNTGAPFNNVMIKSSISSLFPIVFNVSDGYNFTEGSSSIYSNANGFNGMVSSSQFLYTYDGAILKRWNITTGAFINSVIVSSTSSYWGGLSSDGCDNIYVGCDSTIKVYDDLLNYRTSVTLPDLVNDIKADKNNIIYACGIGFVAAVDIIGAPDCPCVTSCFASTPCDTIITSLLPSPTPLPGNVNSELFIPNIFSPNGDNDNSLFKITAIGYENYHLEIYDRWGIKVFESNDANLHWNGKIDNTKQDVPDGTYYHILSIRKQMGIEEKHKGFLMLTR